VQHSLGVAKYPVEYLPVADNRASGVGLDVTCLRRYEIRWENKIRDLCGVQMPKCGLRLPRRVVLEFHELIEHTKE
jgi:hypothetical protein